MTHDPITHALDRLQAVEQAFTQSVQALAWRADRAKPDQTPEWLAWKLGITTPTNAPDSVWCQQGNVGQFSSHQTLARRGLALRLAPGLIEARTALAQAAPVLEHTALILTMPMTPTGDLLDGYWSLADYPLRRIRPSPTSSATDPFRTLLDDLAKAPTPTGTYTIGIKTLRAVSPEWALRVHLRLRAPKSSTKGRKAPQYIPPIHRVWDSHESKAMAVAIVQEWKGQNANGRP